MFFLLFSLGLTATYFSSPAFRVDGENTYTNLTKTEIFGEIFPEMTLDMPNPERSALHG